MSDRLDQALDALQADTDHVGLADAVTVRRRGDRRRRRQRAGSLAAALAGVIALSGGVAEIGAAGPDRVQPAHAPDATTTEAPAPTATPASPEPTPSAPQPPQELDPLLEAAELPDVGAYVWLPRETYDPVDERTAPFPVETMAVCGGDDLSPMMDAQHTMLGVWSTELDASMWEWVAEYPTEAEAAAAVESLDSRCRMSGQGIDALPVGSSLVEQTEVTLDGGFTTAVFGSGPSSEYYGRATGVARRGNVLVVLEFQGMVTAEELDQAAFADTVVSAVERAGTALD